MLQFCQLVMGEQVLQQRHKDIVVSGEIHFAGDASDAEKRWLVQWNVPFICVVLETCLQNLLKPV